MKYLFDPKSVAEMERWISKRKILFGFDFDGTLAPLVKNPAHGTLKKATRDLLIKISRRHPCVILSGRGRADVAKRLPSNAPLIVIGNHGMEWRPELPTALEVEPLVQTWGAVLSENLSGKTHLLVEVKRFSITLHYRSSLAKKQILEQIKKHIRGARSIGGKNVINLIPNSALNKGSAFSLLRHRMKIPYGLFIGDDVTDEDVFRSKPRSSLMTIQIGKPAWSTAKYHVRSQSQIDRVLRWLLSLN